MIQEEFRSEFMADFAFYLKRLRSDLDITVYEEGHEPYNRPYIYIKYNNVAFMVEVDSIKLSITKATKMKANINSQFYGHELVSTCFEHQLSDPLLYESTASFILAETVWSHA